MNDDDLITVLRKQRRNVPMTTPVEQIVSRSRALRARRRVSAVAATLGAAAAAAVAVSVALLPASQPGSHQHSHPAHAQLAAWTVSERADGTVFVRIREFRDPAGLQRKLRADGVPASVIFIQGKVQTHPVSCPSTAPGRSTCTVIQASSYPCRQLNGGHWSQSQLSKVVTGNPFGEGLFIHPSALPRHAGVQFTVRRNHGYYPDVHLPLFLESLVQASPQCTGN
jgi:hypothetical protein